MDHFDVHRPARRRGVMATVLAGLLLCAAVLPFRPDPVGATVVTTAASTGICPAPGQTNSFVDDDGSTHEANINCAAAYGLVGGTSATTFNPSANLTRAQAASILVRYVELSTGSALPSDGAPGFTDIAGNTHAATIAKAAAGGLVNGFADKTFRPGALITRAQFATVAVRATERVLGRALVADANDSFDDDAGSVHEDNIEKAVDNRLLSGVGPRHFGALTDVTRAQAASIVINAAGNVLEPAGRFLVARPFTAQVEWANDRSWAEITSSHDLLWSRSWACTDGTVQTQEWEDHAGDGTRTVRYAGERLLLVDFTYEDGPPVQADGTQQAWYSNLVAPGNSGENGPYAIGEAC